MPDSLYEFVSNGKVSVSNQNNITLTGNLAALAVDGVTILKGNVLANGPIAYFDTVVFFNDVGNIDIPGGNAGEVLTTYGNGVLYWSNGGGGGNASFIANGTSNVSIPSANGNVLISAAGNANVMTISGSEVRINKTANLGNVGNVKISSGNAGEVLTTYGNGTLYWSVNGQLPIDSDSWNYRTQLAGGNSTWINLTSSAVKNKPSYLTGTTVSANNVYPWKQGTSNDTANTNGNNFYLANSTASYAPANAAILLLTDGDDNWYSLAFNDMNGNGTYRITFNCVIVSNANTTIQFVPGYSNSVLSGTFYCPTELMYTIDLIENKQTIIDQIWNFSGNLSFANNAIFVRNITANSNVNFVVGSLVTTES